MEVPLSVKSPRLMMRGTLCGGISRVKSLGHVPRCCGAMPVLQDVTRWGAFPTWR